MRPDRTGPLPTTAACGQVNPAAVRALSDAVFADPAAKLLHDVAWNAGLRMALQDAKVLQHGEADMHVFSDKLVPEMKAADQQHTGLCWAFAGLNLLRRQMAEAYDLPEDFEFSQTFVLFHDKLEKANAFLWNVVELGACDEDDRRLHHLRADPVPDGGGFHTFLHLTRKYGVVPAASMPASAASVDTHVLNAMLRLLLLQTAGVLRHRLGRRATKEACGAVVQEALGRVHRLLCVCLGAPPARVAWTYRRKKDDRVVSYPAATPREFYERHAKLDDRFTILVHVPHLHDAPGDPRGYTVEYIDTVRGMPPTTFVAVSGDELRAAADAALQARVPVWFACEFDQLRVRSQGVLHHELLHHERAIGVPQGGDDKTRRILERRCEPNHAMLLTGRHVDASSGDTVRYQVENSHGAAQGIKDGYLAMTRPWFDRHVLSIAVPTDRYRPSRPAEARPPWDILGFVARATT